MKKTPYLLLSLLILIGIRANAQFNVTYNFVTTTYPYGSLTVYGNKLFGSAYVGGANGYGFFFSINKDGSGFKDIWDCNDTGSTGNANGTYPFGDLKVVNGKLYGFNYDGGGFSDGNIFSIDTDGKGYRDIYDFSGSTGGYPGWGALTLIGNKFFGCSYGGGANSYGCIFSLDTNGTSYQDLFDFDGTNGSYPENVALASVNNKLYGMTRYGGADDSGVIFSIDTNGAGYTDIVDLNYKTGDRPTGYLTLVNNKLYGMTFYGGTNDSGCIFSIDTNGTSYALLLNLGNNSGCYPWGSLTLAGSNLYGMTYEGGIYDMGTIFSIDTNGSNFQKWVDFDGGDNGAYAYGNNFTLSGDTLWGMTVTGGTWDSGVIFSMDTSIGAGIRKLVGANKGAMVYPNPNNGKFTVQSSGIGGQSSVEVYNMLGEKVYSTPFTINNLPFTIDLSSQPSGVYLYRLISEDGNLINEGKVVIEK